MCNKEHKRWLFIVSKIDIIGSNQRTPAQLAKLGYKDVKII